MIVFLCHCRTCAANRAPAGEKFRHHDSCAELDLLPDEYRNEFLDRFRNQNIRDDPDAAFLAEKEGDSVVVDDSLAIVVEVNADGLVGSDIFGNFAAHRNGAQIAERFRLLAVETAFRLAVEDNVGFHSHEPHFHSGIF